ncbi:MAG: proline--tRNA ligase [Coriobacteriia bacterium]|nr:proline--tRNA ligase [Coriobacteriia bacterium]
MSQYIKMSALYAPTLKEDPNEAELASHRLLLRAGMIRRLAAGIYSYLPLAWRAIKKAEQIVREEMDAIGSQEILMPIVQPAELWHESGRWDDYGPELMRLTDRHDRAFALGPTHEEVITTLVKNELKSYKQLPVHMYQIQTKFRDEIRPRFGLLRGREFVMKDAYSFDVSEEALDKTYQAYKGAYERICERMRIDYRAVQADSGQIGGSETIEFMALAESGESDLLFCDCGFAADAEAATAGIQVESYKDGELLEEHTPNIKTIEGLAEFLHIKTRQTVKAMALIDSDGNKVLAFIPGSHELNEIKVSAVLGNNFRIMEDEDLQEASLVKGFIGPIGMKDRGIRTIADVSLKELPYWLVGANKADYHMSGATPGRDFDEPEYFDLALAQEGDSCPQCGHELQSARGIEISQIFKLGTKYSESLQAHFVDEDGEEKPFVMGCYGVGVSRSVAAVIEQYHDEYGIKWPVSIAPYEVSVIALSVDENIVFPVAEKLAQAFDDNGIDVVLDDRNERAGVKFADNDLMGFPYQVICGTRNIEKGQVELKDRHTGEKELIDIDKVVDYLSEKIKAQR